MALLTSSAADESLRRRGGACSACGRNPCENVRHSPLPIIFVTSLFLGWVRIKSGSIIGGWLIHASANIAICLSVAMRTAP